MRYNADKCNCCNPASSCREVLFLVMVFGLVFFVCLFVGLVFLNCSFCGRVGGFIWKLRYLSVVNTAVGTGSACMDTLCIALERLLEKVET